MRIMVLGGTRFVGRAIVEELVSRGHDVVVVHRGESEPDAWIDVEHFHVDRADLSSRRADLATFAPDAAIDTNAMTRRDAESAVAALPDVPTAVLSSMDVYRAYERLLAGAGSEPVPITEASALREHRYPYRGRGPDYDDYDKLDVEEVYAKREATVCRLPVVFGPHDNQRREEWILRRVRAGRRRIPFGVGTWLWSRLHVGDVASAIRLLVEQGAGISEVVNVAPSTTLTVREWAEAILEAADHAAELVPVADELLPADLWLTGDVRQPMLATGERIRALVDWTDRDPRRAVRDSVRWHLANPPDAEGPFEDDDRALASAGAG